MTDVLSFVCLLEEIEFVLKLQEDIPTVLFSLFEKPVTIYKEKQGEISLADSLQIRSCMKHNRNTEHTKDRKSVVCSV